jgi:hypothetical protein
LEFSNAFCNAPTTIKLQRTYLNHETLQHAPAGFQTRIPYTAEVKWDETVVTSVSGLQLSNQAPAAAQTGTIRLKIDVEASELKLAAGNYADTLTLTVTPQ